MAYSPHISTRVQLTLALTLRQPRGMGLTRLRSRRVKGMNLVNNYIPSCEVGEVPLVSIASHADPSAVLATFPKLLRLGYVGAVLWEATWTSDIQPQIHVFHHTNYTVFAAILAPPNTVVRSARAPLWMVRIAIAETAHHGALLESVRGASISLVQ